jgi:hypothetical protein
MKTIASALAATMLFLVTSLVLAQDKSYSPYVGQDFPKNVYFGDTHLHTSLSFDAYGDGNKTMGHEEAYRFAKGEEIKGHDGQPIRMSITLNTWVLFRVLPPVTNCFWPLKPARAGQKWRKMKKVYSRFLEKWWPMQ